MSLKERIRRRKGQERERERERREKKRKGEEKREEERRDDTSGTQQIRDRESVQLPVIVEVVINKLTKLSGKERVRNGVVLVGVIATDSVGNHSLVRSVANRLRDAVRKLSTFGAARVEDA
jgi:hypothetical protein